MAPGATFRSIGTPKGLAPGKHTLIITLLQDKNGASRGRFLNVAGFEIPDEKR